MLKLTKHLYICFTFILFIEQIGQITTKTLN